MFECLGVIVRIVWVAKRFTSGFLATMECVFVLSELCAYSIVTKYRSLKRAFQGDSAGTIAKK